MTQPPPRRIPSLEDTRQASLGDESSKKSNRLTAARLTDSEGGRGESDTNLAKSGPLSRSPRRAGDREFLSRSTESTGAGARRRAAFFPESPEKFIGNPRNAWPSLLPGWLATSWEDLPSTIISSHPGTSRLRFLCINPLQQQQQQPSGRPGRPGRRALVAALGYGNFLSAGHVALITRRSDQPSVVVVSNFPNPFLTQYVKNKAERIRVGCP